MTLAVTVAIGSLIVHLEGSIRLIVTVAILQSTLTSFALKVKLSAPEYPTVGVYVRVRLPRLDGDKNPCDGGRYLHVFKGINIDIRRTKDSFLNVLLSSNTWLLATGGKLGP